MWIWLWMFIVLVMANEESQPIRVAVLDFRARAEIEHSFVAQLTSFGRQGVLNVFPADKSQIIVVTKENISDVLAAQNKEESCLEAECTIEFGRNIGARFIVVGHVNVLDGAFSLSVAIYDSMSNRLVAKESLEKKSQAALLKQAQGFIADVVEQHLGQYDEGRTGVRNIGQDSWTVEPIEVGIVRMFGKKLSGASVSMDGVEYCKELKSSVLAPNIIDYDLGILKTNYQINSFRCDLLFSKGMVRLRIENKDCDPWEKDIEVSHLTEIEVDLDCSFHFLTYGAVDDEELRPFEDSVVHIGTKPMYFGSRISYGSHQVHMNRGCLESRHQVVVDKRGIHHKPNWKQKQKRLSVRDTNSEGFDAVRQVFVDGTRVGTSPYDGLVPHCSQKLTIEGEREVIDLSSLDDWTFYVGGNVK